MCAGFPTVIIDDQSEDEQTLQVIDSYRNYFDRIFVSDQPKAGRKHGNLYDNVQKMCAYATEQGFEYLFMVQDDMQFVRRLDTEILAQYDRMFAYDDKVLQVDPRFLRKAYDYEIIADCKAYRFRAGDYRGSYADVGILRLSTLNALGWKFLDSESENKRALSALGYQRLFPFAPVVMHVPFPVSYRNGRRRSSLLPFNRGSYSYHELTPKEQHAMNTRPLEDIPYFRSYLKPKNMLLARVLYHLVTENSALR